MSEKYSIGIDIGGTKIKVALINETGDIVKIIKKPTRVDEGEKAIKDDLLSMVNSIIGDTSPKAAGIGIAGQIEPNSGTIIFSPNLKWHNVNLKSDLSERLNMPVSVISDVQSATLAESVLGAGRGCKNFICLFIGTGIGGGIYIDGQLYDGSSHTAGEFGHTIVDLNGPKCTCGSWGCMEAYGGGWAIAKQAQILAGSDLAMAEILLKKSGGKIDEITGKMVTDAAKEGDPLSMKVVAKAVEAITAGCINIVNGLNPERLIIGGGVSEGIPELISHIKLGIYQRALSAARAKLQVLNARLGSDAVAIGAGLLAFQNIPK